MSRIHGTVVVLGVFLAAFATMSGWGVCLARSACFTLRDLVVDSWVSVVFPLMASSTALVAVCHVIVPLLYVPTFAFHLNLLSGSVAILNLVFGVATFVSMGAAVASDAKSTYTRDWSHLTPIEQVYFGGSLSQFETLYKSTSAVVAGILLANGVLSILLLVLTTILRGFFNEHSADDIIELAPFYTSFPGAARPTAAYKERVASRLKPVVRTAPPADTHLPPPAQTSKSPAEALPATAGSVSAPEGPEAPSPVVNR